MITLKNYNHGTQRNYNHGTDPCSEYSQMSQQKKLDSIDSSPLDNKHYFHTFTLKKSTQTFHITFLKQTESSLLLEDTFYH